MASNELKNYIQQLDNFAKNNAPSLKIADAYHKAGKNAFGEKDIEFGLAQTKKAKDTIENIVKNAPNNHFRDIWDFEERIIANRIESLELATYYAILNTESRYLLDSYCLYLEKNRPVRERFYLPRRDTLIKVVDKLQALEDDKLDVLFLHQPPRTGKLIADNIPVLTKDGWKNHGDLVVGDYVVSPDGKFVKVLALSKKDIADCLVTFTNGEQIQCHENHEWVVFDRYAQREKVVETKTFLETTIETGEKNKRGHRYRYMIPHRSYMVGEHKELFVDPYVFGVWIGVGTTKKPCVTICDTDKVILEEFEKNGYFPSAEHKQVGSTVYSFCKCGLKENLRKYGLCETEKKLIQKYIPQDYLLADIEQRLQLLAGLIDTDGNLCKKEHRYHYSTCNEDIRDSVVELVNTFGWRVSVTESEPKVSTSGIVGRKTVYVISFNPDCYIPCRVERKQLREYSKQRRIAVKFAEKVNSKQGNCIQVEGGLYCVGKQMIPTHNSQIITMGTSWHCARDTEQSNLYITYKEGLGGAFLDGVCELYTDPTYAFKDMFPEVFIATTDAKNHKMNLVRKKKFCTLSGKGLESGLNGEYDAKGWLIFDDILEGVQDVMNPETLKRKQIVFENNAMSRKKEKCKVVYEGTIWSLHDIYMRQLDFLENNPDAKNVRFDILKIPALNENDESNFNYKYGVGFSTQHYKTTRAKFEENDDMAGWMAQYQQEPIERDGAVFNPEHMKFYNGVLPEEGLYRICAACDVALGGADYLSFPIAYMYENGDVYIHEVVYDNSEKDITQPKIVKAIVDNAVGSAFFESNQGGEGFKDDIERELKKLGIKINMRSEYAPTFKRKETRIWDKAPTIRQWYFRDTGSRDFEYRKFMTNLYSFTVNGKNKHEDAADSLASLAYFIEGSWSQAKVEAVMNPFRSRLFGGNTW